MGTHYGVKTGNSTKLGATEATAAKSALSIKLNNPSATDGVYWIDLPTVGPTQIYCLMDSAWNGGGWMMMMKATTDTTWQYSSTYWSAVNTLNPTDTTRNNANAKYQTMNYYPAKDMLAVFPDITTGTGGSITGRGAWTWLQNNFYAGVKIVPITFFGAVGSETRNAVSAPGGSGYYIQDAKTFSGWASGIWSSQTDIRFYGFNYVCNPAFGLVAKARWGFGWNENAEGLFPSKPSVPYLGSNDVAGGIGLDPAFGTITYAVGDRINCCQDTTGLNRGMRAEIYIR
jgi:hypothetical protein